MFKTISERGGCDNVRKLNKDPHAVVHSPTLTKIDCHFGNLSIIDNLPKIKKINTLTDSAMIMLLIALIATNRFIFYFF